MSTALNKAIRRRLTGQDALTSFGLTAQQELESLLAVDPSSSGNPMVRLGNFASVTVFPSITFRPSGGTSSWISRSEELGTVFNAEYDFEVWDNSRNPDTVTDILDLIEQLLDDRRSVAAPLTLETGHYCAAGSCIMAPVIRYDEQRNAWYGLTRYQFIEQRYKQGS